MGSVETGITGNQRKGSSRLCTIFVVVIILALVALSIAGIYFMVKYSQESDSFLLKSATPPASCLEIKRRGDFSSNYYVIQPDSTHEPFLTYCDMDTDGGGWTLVATVHESDVDKKCVSDDVWVSNGGNTLSETRLWENSEVMLTPPDSSTTHDYKNLGYSKLKASDVMVQHVPNGAAVSESRSKATLGYYTNNKFLENYGGNLKSVFADHFPLSPVRDDDQVFGASVIEKMLDALEEKANAGGILNVTAPPDLYQYMYNDSTPDRLTNGGNNLFDPYGMLISLEAPNCTKFNLIYGETYDCAELSSRKSFPFFALVKTNNNTNTSDTSNLYRFSVTSMRSNGDDQRVEGSYTSADSKDFSVNYFYKCRYSDSVPSYCDMWFTVYSEKWGSESLLGSTISSTQREYATHANAVYGYTMLARDPPAMTEYELSYKSFMKNVVDILLGFEDIDLCYVSMRSWNLKGFHSIVTRHGHGHFNGYYIMEIYPHHYAVKLMEQKNFTGNFGHVTLFHSLPLLLEFFQAEQQISDIQGMLDALAIKGADFIEPIPDFRQYTYDDTSPSRLTDGGGIFFPYGMEVQVTLRGTDTNVTLDYGKSYTLNDDLVQVSSRKSYPFFALARTENLDHLLGFKYTEGRSRFDYRGSGTSDTGRLKIGNFEMSYYSSYSLNNTAPGVCNIIFFIRNEKEWNSKPLTETSFSETGFLQLNISDIEYDFAERTTYSKYTNSITGYTLLAREPGSIYERFPAEEVLYNILEVISRFPNIVSNCATPSNNLVVPVQYINASDEKVNLMTPPEFRDFVTPGHLQFRAIGYNGHVYALCPAVRVDTCYSRFLCVGGVTKSSETTDDCSDFLDWSDSVNRDFSTPLPSEATGRMHSKTFIESTMMIFYR